MRGKILIVVMVTAGLTAAGFAWWWNYQRSDRARRFWGPSAATIRFAKKVEALRLERPAGPATVDITGRPGLLNATTSLMSDDSFDWSVEPFSPKPSREWNLGVRFQRESDRVTLLFSSQRDALLVSDRGEAVMLNPKTAAGWRSYLEKALAQQLP